MESLAGETAALPPFNGLSKTFFKPNEVFVADRSNSQGIVGLRMLYIAGSGLQILGIDLFADDLLES